MKNKKTRWGIFAKLSVSFVVVGLLPLFLISLIFFKTFSINVRNIVLNDAEVMLQSASSYVDAMLEEWEESTEQIYTRSVEQGIYLTDILLDEQLSEQQRNHYIRRFLAKWESLNGLKSVRFIDADGDWFYFSQTVGKVVNQSNMEKWRLEELEKSDTNHEMEVEKIHEDSYFSNINDHVITIKRNLFDVSSVKNVNQVLGTIYIDISEEAMTQQLKEIELGNRSGLYIIDKNRNQIYKEEGQKSLSDNTIEKLIQDTEGIQEDDRYYYSCRENGEWISVLRIHKGDIQKNIDQTRQYIFILLCASMVVLLSLYFVFSKKFSTPISRLKEGMEQIQKGNLDTRVKIGSRDELGALAEGLNQMAGELKKYINRVYGAEIKQKDAELKALKSQIKPHYLYNTLDIIRMTAVGNEDRQTAEMIENLARQLRYLMGEEREVVALEQELNSIRDYFALVSIRYENKMNLTISVREDLLKIPVLKLILQPIVENAVKHGLKPKNGSGNIWISASKTENILELTVMDNGVGMSQEDVERLKIKLMNKSGNLIAHAEEGGVGICNVQERIQNRYGNEFGVKIESTEGKGTIMIVQIPVSGN